MCDCLKPNVRRNAGSQRAAISIISQRRSRLNYQHGCVQTGAQLITLGWSPCCLCPRSATSQLTTWRFIGAGGSTRGNNFEKLSSSALPFHLERAVRGRGNGPNSFHSEMHNAGAASGRDAALRFGSPPPNDYCFFHIRQSVRSSWGRSNMLGCPFFLHLRDLCSHQHPRRRLRMWAGAKTWR